MAKLELKNINKIFGKKVHIIKDLNMTMNDGEFTVFVGPSGCGKSTVLRMISGLESITSGDFLIDGVKSNNLEPQKRGVAMVFQAYALYPHLTVHDNIAFPLSIKKVDKATIEKKVQAVSKVLDLDSLLHRTPRELSGGQCQRVALGRAMVRKPKIFLLDEPLSNLDAKLRSDMRIEIAQLHQKLNTNFIYVTHDQVEAMTLGQRILVIKDGILQHFASPIELYNHPANMFVGGFIGSPSMNFFEAELKDIEGHKYIVSESFKLKLMDDYKPFVDKYNKKKVILGIRPVDIYLKETRYERVKDPDNVINGKFILREILGDEVLYYIGIPSLIVEGEEDEKKSMVIKENMPVDYEPNSAFSCYADPEKYYLFDIDTRESILKVKGQH